MTSMPEKLLFTSTKYLDKPFMYDALIIFNIVITEKVNAETYTDLQLHVSSDLSCVLLGLSFCFAGVHFPFVFDIVFNR